MTDSCTSLPASLRAGKYALALVLALTGPGSAFNLCAHEYWIEPLQYRIAVGAPLQAELKNGEQFKGLALPYMPPRFTHFSINNPSGSTPVTGILGDLPALQQRSETPGPHVLAYQGKHETIRYNSYDKFSAFVTKEGIEWVLAAHRQRGLTTLSVQEAYQRFAKALIEVESRPAAVTSAVTRATANTAPQTGNHAQADNSSPGLATAMDSLLGMEFELLLHAPAVSEGTTSAYRATVYYQQKPASDIQVSVFTKRGGLLARYRSDASGDIHFSVPTPDAVLLNAVHARVPSTTLQQQTGAAWETLWASLTFRSR